MTPRYYEYGVGWRTHLRAQQRMEVLDIVVNPTGGDSDDELAEEELHVAESVVPRELKAIGGTIGSERSGTPEMIGFSHQAAV